MSFGPRPATAPVTTKSRSRQAAPPNIRPANQPSFTGPLDSVVDCSERPKLGGVHRADVSRCLAESAPIASKRHIHQAPPPTIADQPAIHRKRLIPGHTPNEESPFPKKTAGKRPFSNANGETEPIPFRSGKHVPKTAGPQRNPIVWGTPRVANVRRETFRSNIIAWATSPREIKRAAPPRLAAAAPYDVSSGGKTMFNGDVGIKPKFRKCFASVASRPKTARGLLTWVT